MKRAAIVFALSGGAAMAQLLLTITTTSPLPNGTTGAPYSLKFAASGGTPPYRWSGSAPAGLSLASDGSLTGTPSKTGDFKFTVTVQDSLLLSAKRDFTVTIQPPPLTITTPSSLPSGTVGASYSQTLAATGGTPPYRWSGSPPAGLSLSNNGAITGTPSSAGTFNFTVSVTDSASLRDSRQFTLSIAAAPAPLSINTPATLPSAPVRTPYSQTLTASGGTPPYAWSVTSGFLPSGISLNANGSLAGSAISVGAFNFTVQVKDAASMTASQAFSLSVTSSLTITTAPSLPPAVAGVGYSQGLSSAGGAPPLTWSITSGALPPGVSINSSSGLISGTPSATGAFNFTVQVADSASASVSQAFSLTVTPKLSITTAPSLPQAAVGTNYSQLLSSTGGSPPITWSITTGALPAGLSINASSGIISGVPNAAGVSNFTVQVKDAASATATQAFSLTVVSGLTITTAPFLAPALVGTSYSQTLSSTAGVAPFTWRIIAGALPAGLSINGLTGAITGVPGAAGVSNFTVQVTDSASATATQQFTISVTAAPGFFISSGPALPGGMAGAMYSQTLIPGGGRPPYVWSVVSGALPPGLTLDAASGVISGVPAAVGPFAFSIQVTDNAGGRYSGQFTLNVDAPQVPALTLNAVPDVADAAQQFALDLNLAGAYPLPISGTLTLRFSPNAAIAADDPAIQFSTGGRSASFVIPPNSTQPDSPLWLQTGTVAGSIQLDVTLQGALGFSRVIRINPSAPAIRSLKVVRNQGGFELQLSGFSTTREVTQATVRFAGAGLQTTDVAVPLADVARSWYQSAASTPFGSQFALRLPFTVQGSASAIQSAAVTISNAQGASQAASVDFGP